MQTPRRSCLRQQRPAETGELLFLIGDDSDAVAAAAPIFNALGRGMIHLGKTRSGARMKLIFLTGVQLASFAEELVWIELSAFNKEAAIDLLLNGAGGSPMIRNIAPRMLERNYTVNSPLPPRERLFLHL
jgi:3-hydroxyisobutyrate dehydrogenase